MYLKKCDWLLDWSIIMIGPFGGMQLIVIVHCPIFHVYGGWGNNFPIILDIVDYVLTIHALVISQGQNWWWMPLEITIMFIPWRGMATCTNKLGGEVGGGERGGIILFPIKFPRCALNSQHVPNNTSNCLLCFAQCHLFGTYVGEQMLGLICFYV